MDHGISLFQIKELSKERIHIKIKRLEQKWHNFIERLRLSEDDYLTMKRQSENYEKMLSTINVEVKCDSEDITDKLALLLTKMLF